MSAKPTPGPWGRDKYGHIIDKNGRDILFRSVSIMGSGDRERIDEAEANTFLASAAPDLLQALSELLAMCERQEDFNDDGDGMMFDRARAAIDKAIPR